MIGDVPAHDALGETLDDGCLTDAGLADQHRVVLGPAAQHLHHAPDFILPPDYRVELALARGFGQIMSIAFQGLILGLGILIGDALRAAHRNQCFQNSVVSGAGAVEQLPGRFAAPFCQGQQQMLGGDEFVLEPRGFLKGTLQHFVQRRRQIHPGLHRPSLGQGRQKALGFCEQRVRPHSALFQYGPYDSFRFLR